jgi:hypothetical protein
MDFETLERARCHPDYATLPEQLAAQQSENGWQHRFDAIHAQAVDLVTFEALVMFNALLELHGNIARFRWLESRIDVETVEQAQKRQKTVAVNRRNYPEWTALEHRHFPGKTMSAETTKRILKNFSNLVPKTLWSHFYSKDLPERRGNRWFMFHGGSGNEGMTKGLEDGFVRDELKKRTTSPTGIALARMAMEMGLPEALHPANPHRL